MLNRSGTMSFLILLAGMSMATLVLAQGKPDLKTYFGSDLTDQVYKSKTHRRVGLAWKRPDRPPARGNKAVVITTLSRDGSISKVTLKWVRT